MKKAVKKPTDKTKLKRFRQAVEGAIDNTGYIPPEWAGDPLILKLMLITKELAVTHRKAAHGCYDFNCPECDV